MIDLGTDSRLHRLARVTLTRDEMDLLLDRLALDELPVVLDQFPRFDDSAARTRAFDAAAATLTDRGLLVDEVVDPALAARLNVLNRPRWVVALRLFSGDAVSRLCVASDGTTAVLALRGPESYVLDELAGDVGKVVVDALGAAAPIAFGGFSAPTVQLAAVFDSAADVSASLRSLAEIAVPPRESDVIAHAMVHCYAHTEIVAIRYGDGTRTQVDSHVAVFDTRSGRFVATSSIAGDDTKWSALSSGTDARVRQAVNDLVAAVNA